MVMTIEGFIIWLVIGAIAGWLAGLIMKGYGFGLIGNIVVGIVGALIAGWLLPRLGFVLIGGFGAAFINAIIGAVILVAVIGVFKTAACMTRWRAGTPSGLPRSPKRQPFFESYIEHTFQSMRDSRGSPQNTPAAFIFPYRPSSSSNDSYRLKSHIRKTGLPLHHERTPTGASVISHNRCGRPPSKAQPSLMLRWCISTKKVGRYSICSAAALTITSPTI